MVDSRMSAVAKEEDDCSVAGSHASENTGTGSERNDSEMQDEVLVSEEGEDKDDKPGHKLTFHADADILDEEGRPKVKQQKMTRNMSEKYRRDRLNAYIGELAKIVPLTMSSNKKMDKASILRLTVTYLRIYHDLVRKAKNGINLQTDILTYENLGQTILDSVGGFMFVINKKGYLIFATDGITDVLGHDLVDILGFPLNQIVHDEDHAILASQLTNKPKGDSPRPTPSTDSEFDTPVHGHRNFCMKMLNVKNKQTKTYEQIQVVGHVKTSPGIQPIGAPPGMHPPAEDEVHLIAVGKLVRNQPIMELSPALNTDQNQWITRHELDGQITYSDPRGSWLTGFMPGESIGLSAYALLHPDDIGPVVELHNSFLSQGMIPNCTFRMYTKSRDILWIQTSTHMVLDMWTKKPKFIISINDVLSEEQGKMKLEKQLKFIQERTQRLAIESGDEDDTLSTVSSASSSNGVSSPSGSSICPSPRIIPPDPDSQRTTAKVTVGEKTYTIDLSKQNQVRPQPNNAFDPHSDGGRGESIPLVHPTFLGDEDSPSSASPSPAPRTNGHSHHVPSPPPAGSSLLLELLNKKSAGDSSNEKGQTANEVPHSETSEPMESDDNNETFENLKVSPSSNGIHQSTTNGLNNKRYELSEKLLAKQRQLEESIKLQRQELARLKEQLAATQEIENNSALMNLEKKCHVHDQELQALKAEYAHLNKISQKGSSSGSSNGMSHGRESPLQVHYPGSPSGNGISATSLAATLQSLTVTTEGKALVQTLILALKQGSKRSSSSPAHGSSGLGSSCSSTAGEGTGPHSGKSNGYHRQPSTRAPASPRNGHVSPCSGTSPGPPSTTFSAQDEKVQSSPQVSSTTATSDHALSDQISPPHGTSNDGSPAAKNGGQKFDLLRKLLTEYKEKQSRETQSDNSFGKPSSQNGYTNGVNSNEGCLIIKHDDDIGDDMQINIDRLLLQLGDLNDMDLSSLNEIDLSDL